MLQKNKNSFLQDQGEPVHARDDTADNPGASSVAPTPSTRFGPLSSYANKIHDIKTVVAQNTQS